MPKAEISRESARDVWLWGKEVGAEKIGFSTDYLQGFVVAGDPVVMDPYDPALHLEDKPELAQKKYAEHRVTLYCSDEIALALQNAQLVGFWENEKLNK